MPQYGTYTAISSTQLAATDTFLVLDVSDFTDSTSGSVKRLTSASFKTYVNG